MAKNRSIIEESKKYLNNFYVNGQWLEEPLNIRINGRDVEPRVMDFMYNFFRFLIEGTMISNCTIIWLTSNLSNVREAIEHYNSQQLEIDQLNMNTAQSKIQYDKNKLMKHFDSDLLFHVMVDPDKYLEPAVLILDKLMRAYMDDYEYRKALAIKPSKEFIVKEIDEYSWALLCELLRRYNKSHIEEIEKGTDKEFNSNILGYYNYLISCKKLNKEEKARLNTLRNILGLKEL